MAAVRRLILLIGVLVGLAACGPARPADPYARVTFRPSPTLTATPRPATPIPYVPELPTARPRVNLTPSPTPLPTLPPSLDERGPWLLLERTHPLVFPVTSVTPAAAPAATAAPDDPAPALTGSTFYLANADGSLAQAAALPPAYPPDRRTWLAKPAPRGGLVAFRQVPVGAADPAELLPGTGDDTLWIIGLPENRVVRKIGLLGPEAWDTITSTQDDAQARGELPLTQGLTGGAAAFIWSPDGRYLAFAAALEGPAADIYIYSPDADEIRRLTTAADGAQPWFWSPDGRRLVYRTCQSYQTGIGPADFSGVYAVDPLGGVPVKLYQPAGAERVVQITRAAFYAADYRYEGSLGNLRKVEFNSGQVSHFFPNPFTAAAVSPDGLVLLYFQNSPPLTQFGLETGVYWLDTATWALNGVIATRLQFLHWDNDWQAFVALREKTAPGAPPGPVSLFAFQIDHQGKLNVIPASRLAVRSPDQRWLVWRAANPTDPVRVSGWDEKMITLDRPGARITWLADSSGFYALDLSGGPVSLSFYPRSGGWQPQGIPGGPPNAPSDETLADYWVITP